MTTLLEKKVEGTAVEAAELSTQKFQLATWVALLAMVVGAISVFGGIFGVAYTWDQAADQNITTPDDAVIAEAAVRGPFTMWSQSDIITHHQLDRTDGLYYAEMDRFVPMVDEAGNPVIDEATGETVMLPNEARASWFNATTLTTALGLGILAYAFSAFAIVMGITMFLVGLVLYRLRTPLAALR